MINKIPSFKKKKYEDVLPSIHLGETYGRATPKNKSRGCLCKGKDTYSKKCCDGKLPSQGIGLGPVG
jgi:hypothetical protein